MFSKLGVVDVFMSTQDREACHMKNCHGAEHIQNIGLLLKRHKLCLNHDSKCLVKVYCLASKLKARSGGQRGNRADIKYNWGGEGNQDNILSLFAQ